LFTAIRRARILKQSPYLGVFSLYSGLMFKVAFWLILLGILALMAPNPAWPEWLARMVLSTGIALVVTGFIAPRLKRHKKKGSEDD